MIASVVAKTIKRNSELNSFELYALKVFALKMKPMQLKMCLQEQMMKTNYNMIRLRAWTFVAVAVGLFRPFFERSKNLANMMTIADC
jgi:hypothetical protein